MGLNYYKIKKNVLKARKLVIKGTTAAASGHPGGSFSMAEIMGCLFNKYLRFDPKNPLWEDRDRLILSKGHASPGLFSNLAVAGFFDESEIETLRQFGSRLQGHPDYKCPGVEFCGGSLGIGLSFSIGNALAAKIDSKQHRIFTIIGDGESNEGQVWEAAMTGAKYKVDNMTVFLDRNFIQQDSYTEKIMPLDEELVGDELSEMWKDASRWKLGDKWRSFGWNVIEIDGHRIEQIDAALKKATQTKNVPTIIVARKVKGCSEGRADYIHLDVMDGQFVPNTTFDHNKIKELRPYTVIPFDAHLMINEPVKHVTDYINAGCDIITVHAEVCDESSFGEIHDTLRQNQVGVGLAINPDTELPEWSFKFLSDLDQLIVMSVVPGKSGQKYIESTHQKTQNLAKVLVEQKFDGFIEADGGVDLNNVGQCFVDGARAFVGGSAIIGQKDVRGVIADFRKEILKARRTLLIKKAYDLGGKDLVNNWIGLHLIGDKKTQLIQMAKELGYT